MREETRNERDHLMKSLGEVRLTQSGRLLLPLHRGVIETMVQESIIGRILGTRDTSKIEYGAMRGRGGCTPPKWKR